MPLFFVKSKPSQPRTIAQIYKLFQEKIENFWATSGKGLREGEAGVMGAEKETPQTPGDTPSSPEDQTRERLAADAKDKEGVASQADGDSTATPDDT